MDGRETRALIGRIALARNVGFDRLEPVPDSVPTTTDDRFELAPPPSAPFTPVYDPRPHVPEPLPVRLVAINDVHLTAKTGSEHELESLYIGLLGFERADDPEGLLRMRSDNFDVIFTMGEPPITRDAVRPLCIEVPSLPVLEEQLIAAGVEYLPQKTVQAGQESILVLDSGGNWIEVRQIVLVR